MEASHLLQFIPKIDWIEMKISAVLASAVIIALNLSKFQSSKIYWR